MSVVFCFNILYKFDVLIVLFLKIFSITSIVSFLNHVIFNKNTKYDNNYDDNTIITFYTKQILCQIKI